MRTLLTDPCIGLDSVVRVSENRFHQRKLTRPDKDAAGATAVREEWQILSGFTGHPAPPRAGPRAA